MAEFSKLVITSKGQALIAKMIAGTGNIEFTKICASSATYIENQLEALTFLADIKQTGLVSKVTRTNEVTITVKTAFTNTDLTEGYYMRALGLYAIDPDEGEILYAVTTETSGNCYMPPYNGITVSGAYIQLVTTVGNAESVSFEVNEAAVATIGDIQELQDQIEELKTTIGSMNGDISKLQARKQSMVLWSGAYTGSGSLEFYISEKCFHNYTKNLTLVIEGTRTSGVDAESGILPGDNTAVVSLTFPTDSSGNANVADPFASGGAAYAYSATDTMFVQASASLKIVVEKLNTTDYAKCEITSVQAAEFTDRCITCIYALVPEDSEEV